MRIGFIDVDADYRKKVTYPNLALMKLSAYHKRAGDVAEWHKIGVHYDRVYVSKVFSDEYTKEQLPFIDADEIIRGGSGYAIDVQNGRECYHAERDPHLNDEVEHIMPDYSLYGLTDDAYGFLTRGCPRGCNFCHVAAMQGRRSYTVARLSEFWNGQKRIHLNDPNILACKDWKMHFEDLAKSGARVDFNQGLDVRLLTEEKAAALNEIKYSAIHFAWDRYEDHLEKQLAIAKEVLKRNSRQYISVYILTNSGSTIEQDIERVEYVKSLGFQPYVMVYRQSTAPKEVKRLKRYANNPFVCWQTPTYKDYDANARSERYGKTGTTHKQKIDFASVLAGSNDDGQPVENII